jgi:KaiC/GvpD/RAD55 family RecA-like ATPase
LWEKVRSKYITDAKLANISFDSPKREFHLEEVDEKTRLAVAVEMLLRMPEIPDVERVMVQRESLEKTKEEIVQILKEKILLLPEELLSEFDECRYYPLLLERAMNDLLTHLETFIPEDEHKMIFERLRRRDGLFNCIDFEKEEIRIKEGTRFGRAAFLTLFKLYLEAVEEKFPFKRCLLRGLVKEEIKKELHPTIAVGDVINIVPTGLKEIDMVIAGGFVKGSITLLITEETEAKQKLLLSFIKKGLTEGMSVIYATSKRPFQQIVGELLVDAESIKNFVILDLYETLYTENRGDELIEEEQRVIVPLNKILFQRSVVKTIKSHQKDKPRIVIIDVYDDFSKYYSPEEIYEILQSQVEGLKRWNCTSLIVLDPQSYLMKRKGMDEVKKHFENILILSGGDKETTVVVEKLYHGTPFKPVIYVPW